MANWPRLILLSVVPLLVAVANATHPIIHSAVYDGIFRHLDWWINLHLLNLVGFPLVGFACYFLTLGSYSPAAIVSRIAGAIFIPLYAAFDSLAGIGTGTLVRQVSRLPPNQSATFEPVIAAYWNSETIMTLAIIGSIAWTIATLSAAVALTVRNRRRWVAAVSVVAFFVSGWARTNLMSPDGSNIAPAWWLVLFGIGAAMFLVAKPRTPALLLALAGVLFGAAHTMPTGPLGLICFSGGAAFAEFSRSRE